ncbi:MAG: class I SAM-dependent methyltransferase [Chloroflexaceae bacterium]
MSLQQIKRQWDALGNLDPLWAMTGTNKFNAWDLEEFLRTGDRQVDQLLDHVKKYNVPHGHDWVLDFGCGVGRMARGFRRHFSNYVGLDISHSLIAKACNLYRSDRNSFFFVNTTPRLSLPPHHKFDLIHCWGVLHHVADQEIVLQYIAEFVRRLAENGLLVFTVLHELKPIYRIQIRRRLYVMLNNLGIPDTTLYERLRLYPQQVHAIPRARVTAKLAAPGARILDTTPEGSPKSSHQFWTYYVTGR